MDKKTYRSHWLEKRKHFSPEKLQAFENQLLSYIGNLPPQTIFTYYSVEDEIPTQTMIETFCHYHTILLPKTDPKTKTMVPCQVTGSQDLVPGPFQLIEPNTPAYKGPIDLCLVPGLVFDQKGYRIGYGGGYYDRFLKDNPAKTLGLCLEEQILPLLPHDSLDLPVQALLTEKGLVLI